MAALPDTVSRPHRGQAIEALRIIATFAIVAFHEKVAFSDVVYSGLIVFLILSPMLDIHYNWDRVRSVKVLAERLLMPWAFWMLIYAAINVVRGNSIIMKGEGVSGLLYGTSSHLWFLPFIFLVLVALNVWKQWINQKILFWASAVCAVVFLANAAAWQGLVLSLPPPFAQWLHAAPAVLIGIVFGLVGRNWPPAVAALAALAIALLLLISNALPGLSFPYAIGVISVAAVVMWGPRLWPGWDVQPIADCMLGVYLSHMAWLSVFRPLTGSGSYLNATVSFFVALLVVYLARRYIPKSKYALG